MRAPMIYSGKAKILDARLKKARSGSRYIGIEYELPDGTTYGREWYLNKGKALELTKRALQAHGLDLTVDLALGLDALRNTTVYIVVRQGQDQYGEPKPEVWWMDPPLDEDDHEDARKLLVGSTTADDDELIWDDGDA